MVVEVLRPHDCLKDPTRRGLLSPPMKHHHQHQHQRNPNPNRVVQPQPQPDRRKQRKPTRPTTNVVQKAPVLAGQVKILKRGEELPKRAQPQPPQSAAAAPKERRSSPHKVPVLGSTERMGLNPKKVPKQTRVNPALGFYAGSSSCIASPPPSSVPLPSFFAKKTVASSTDEAASELLKLLRLNLS